MVRVGGPVEGVSEGVAEKKTLPCKEGEDELEGELERVPPPPPAASVKGECVESGVEVWVEAPAAPKPPAPGVGEVVEVVDGTAGVALGKKGEAVEVDDRVAPTPPASCCVGDADEEGKEVKVD